MNNKKQKFEVGDLIAPTKNLRFSVWNPGDVVGTVIQHEVQQRLEAGSMPKHPLLFDSYEVKLSTGKIVKIADVDYVFTRQMQVALIGEGWMFAHMWKRHNE